MAGSSSASYINYNFQLFNRRTGRPIDDDSGLYEVLTASDPTRATVYSDAKGTSLTQPATMTNGWGTFWTARSTTSVDVSVLTASGKSYFIEGLTPSQHRVDVDPEKLEYTFICRWHANTASNVVADTGFDLIAGMRIKDVFLHVTTAIATGCTIDIGISGDTDAFLDGVNAGSSTGYRVGDINFTTNATDLANAQFVSTVQFRGVSLLDFAPGIITALVTLANTGVAVPKQYIVTAATSLVWVLTLSNTAGTGEGYIYVQYDLVPTAGN